MKICHFSYQEIAPGVQRVLGFFPEEFVGLQTTRVGGVSAAPFESFNLAGHVGDSLEAVEKNRARLSGLLPGEVVWLEQVHGCGSIVIARNAEGVMWQSADGGLPRGFAARNDRTGAGVDSGGIGRSKVEVAIYFVNKLDCLA